MKLIRSLNEDRGKRGIRAFIGEILRIWQVGSADLVMVDDPEIHPNQPVEQTVIALADRAILKIERFNTSIERLCGLANE